MKENVSKKIDGKWRNFGNIKVNKFNNRELGLRCTPELKQLIAGTEEGGWLNFALFPDDGQRDKPSPASKPTQTYDDSEIPF